MRRQAVSAIGDAMADIGAREGIAADHVVKVVLEGNTAMLALLSGRNYHLLLQPSYWVRRIDCLPDNPKDLALSWGVHPEAIIEILPPVAGFVGSDLMAGVIATRLTETGSGSLLIDFGGNSEIALWDGKTLWATSAAGGPAFEGCGISCGMPAESGAIYRVCDQAGCECQSAKICGFADVGVQQDAGIPTAPHGIAGMNLEFRTINGENPIGLCGSGIVDLVACLVRSGKLTSTGRFAPDVQQSGVALLDGERPLKLTRRDVDVFQRAKGAISAAVRVLLSMAGMTSADLKHIYVGGAFGHFLNKVNAVSIGLLPPVDCDSIQLCGNTALAGCEYLLMARDSVELPRKIITNTKLINLSQSSDFADFFLDGLYLSKWPEGI
jgi:uncharacterized 2Fe-2S/4Fe-4S cluster protein (DUF4445 family)